MIRVRVDVGVRVRVSNSFAYYEAVSRTLKVQ